MVTGIGAGCEQSGCALVGGETAEMPGMYEGEDYDIAGFCVGVVEKSEIIDGSKVGEGDALIALAASGPLNGFSLVRKILEVSKADVQQPLGDTTLANALLEPTRIYVKPVLKLIKECGSRPVPHHRWRLLGEHPARAARQHPGGDRRAELAVAGGVQLAAAGWQRYPPRDVPYLQLRRRHDHRPAGGSAGKSLTLLKAEGENAWHIGHIAKAVDGEEQVIIQ